MPGERILDLCAAHHFKLDAASLELGDCIDVSDRAAVGGRCRDVLNVRLEAELVVEGVLCVHRPGLQADDLAGASGEVDHAAIADDELSVRAAGAVLAVTEGQQVAMPESGARFEAEGRTLKDGTVEAFRSALEERRGLAAFGHDDASQTVGRHALRHGKRHLLLELRGADDVDERYRAVWSCYSGLLLSGSDLLFESVGSRHSVCSL